MNQYGSRAKEYVTRHAPSQTAGLKNPDAFFQDLGARIEGEIERAVEAMDQAEPKKTDYLERAAQLNSYRRAAEEVALHNHLYSAMPPEPTSTREELEELLDGYPTSVDFDLRIERVKEEALERTGNEALIDEGDTENAPLVDSDRALIGYYQRMRSLVDWPGEGWASDTAAALDAMSEDQMAELLAELKRHWNPIEERFIEPFQGTVPVREMVWDPDSQTEVPAAQERAGR